MRDMIACDWIASGAAEQDIKSVERYEDIVRGAGIGRF